MCYGVISVGGSGTIKPLKLVGSLEENREVLIVKFQFDLMGSDVYPSVMCYLLQNVFKQWAEN